MTNRSLLLCFLALSSGCAAVGVIAHKAVGPSWVEPVYKPADTPMLVWAEAARGRAMAQADADRLGRQLLRDVERNKIAPVLDHARFHALRDSSPAGSPAIDGRSVRSVGEEVNAGQVLYVEVLGVGVSSAGAGDVVTGEASARVRVVDIPAGRVVFPPDSSEGHGISFETPVIRLTPSVTPDSVRAAAIAGLSDRITKLFYRWQPDQESDLMLNN